MTFKEIRNEFWAELDYKKKYYHSVFHIMEPVRTAFFAWCVTMTVLFSIVTEGGIALSNLEDITRWGLIVVAAALAVKVLTNIFSWDIINSVTYFAESALVWVGYFLGVMIPVGDSSVGKLFITTAICVMFSGAAALMVDAARRAILK